MTFSLGLLVALTMALLLGGTALLVDAIRRLKKDFKKARNMSPNKGAGVNEPRFYMDIA